MFNTDSAICMTHTFNGIVIDLKGGKGTSVRGISQDDTSSDDQHQQGVKVGESEKEAKALINVR